MKIQELLNLSEMAKRSTPDAFYALAKKKYGAEKVKSLKWPEVVAVAKEADVLIPPYLRDQKVGRGLFNLVPPEHEDGKAKAEPKAEPKAKSYARPQVTNTYYGEWSEFYAAMKKEFVAFELGRVPFGPQVHGRFGIQHGEKLMVDLKTDKVMGIWTVTGGDKIPGRGIVAYGRGALAKADQSVPVKKAEERRMSNTGGGTEAEMKAALDDVKDEIYDRHANFDPIEKQGKGYELGVRYWGDWEGDDGSGDYDHQELSRSSSKEMTDVLRKVEKKHKSVKLSFQTGEKNWLYIRAE